MFNSIAFNAVIGLVFIYLLYSLLVTITGEIISSYLKMRSKILRQAIERMLTDGVPRTAGFFNRLLQKLSEFFLLQHKSFTNIFAGRFYNSPEIKFLTEGSKKLFSEIKSGQLSYIPKEAFSQSIVHLFRNKGEGKSDLEKIDYCMKYNILLIDPQTLSYFKDLVADSGKNLDKFVENLEAWFDDTMERTNGWYKKKIKIILFLLGFIISQIGRAHV